MDGGLTLAFGLRLLGCRRFENAKNAEDHGQRKRAQSTASGVNQPKEDVACGAVHREHHAVGRGGTGYIHPVRAEARIGLGLQAPTGVIRGPRQRQRVTADGERNVC